jgi:trans-aconitate methyltransferase
MNDFRQQTIDVYNQNAEAMAEKFRAIPPRAGDVALAFQLAGNPEHAKVVEIGCGDGRDAREIAKKAGSYLGLDISSELIKLAQKFVPEGKFEVADAPLYDYPDNIDIVFAFASFLHLTKEETRTVFEKLSVALRAGGVIYLSLKWAPEYKVEAREDRFGTRQYYFYNQELIEELAGSAFETVHSRRETLENANHVDWVELVLKKTT